ncbi:hypothetical protein N7523_005778 [Penicillium sp. IBT 18751x]|nr:hypothetical protein N7523_005631 [Penicillium sp. IBT 18751x]KAJ6118027.1 hypothetical protein N7523_005778 [Penicillium sp. IBT 18751x]
MNKTVNGSAGGIPDLLGNGGTAFRPRGYQLEMLEASRQQNIIVAMDTGSGKTHIAVLRIIDELEGRDPGKLVWFLAPTVALCLQQHGVIKSMIPSAKTRVLTGLDNVDRWTEQTIWDNVLKDIRVVVSTHAVLADALTHGFVCVSQLALIIFDEAHHCMRGHPANKIMQNHYHPARSKFGPDAVPKILGLTASPIVRSSSRELQTIEANLNAVCKTPRIHRSELLEHVHRPQLQTISYLPHRTGEGLEGSRLLLPLRRCVESFDPQNDPYTELLRQKPETRERAEKALKSGKTFCSEQLTKFLQTSYHIYEELGGWATDYFIRATVEQLRRTRDNDTSLSAVDYAEKSLLLGLLLSLPVFEVPSDDIHLSPKLEALFAFLEKMDHPKFSGLLFAKRRSTVTILVCVLSVHPATRDRFRSASYVGWSNSSRKEHLGDLLTRDTQRDTLSEFRAGQKNLIVATDVLEEGLDVSTCSVVVCYDKPPNLKSFVQRRGRARHQRSTYAIMKSMEDASLDLQNWQELEQAMVRAYQNDERRRREAWELESIDEEVASSLFVPSTSARMSADDAIQHLLHFCAVLPIDDYADNRPMFSFEEDMSGRIRGTVTLPSSVHPAVRRAQGKQWWRTERAARKEVSFLAYKALYVYGLVNDNLLPLTRKSGELQFIEDIHLPGVLECSEQYDPYVELAHAWEAPQLHQTTITVSNQDNGDVVEDLSMAIVLPEWTAMPDPILLYWEPGSHFIAKFAGPEPIEATSKTVTRMRHATSIYLQSLSPRVRCPSQDFVALFVPSIPQEKLEEWLCQYEGDERALDLYSRDVIPNGVIRNSENRREACHYRRWICGDDKHIYVECQSIRRRRNLLQDGAFGTALPKIHVVPALDCTVGRLPASKALSGLLIPALLDRLEATLVATRLNDTILRNVGIHDLGHILTAITAPIAQAATNYQRYEFFGDSILKFTVSYQLFFTQPRWHEGYLSESRDKLVNNKRLARAALDAGLDKFILTKRFTPRKWDAPLVSQKSIVGPSKLKRHLSVKVLADVVEALIGAAYLDGGMHKAQACLQCFLPEINTFTSDMAEVAIVAHVETNSLNDTNLRAVSRIVDQHRLFCLIGYAFKNAALLTEALTHPSCDHDAATQSYQRLEYLGDAVLDIIVMSMLASHSHQLSQGMMTLIKHAVVNANLLAFLCMDFGVRDPTPDVDICQTPGGEVNFISQLNEIHLWHFLRFNGPAIKIAREACSERYKTLRDQIKGALEHGSKYPWELLACLRADKFLSDIVESTVGAIFIDSCGNLDQCQAFVELIGLLAFLRRIISETVDVEHPRSSAQSLVKRSGTLVFKTERIQTSGATATYRSWAMINKEGIALVEGCGSAEEAEVKVSQHVIEKVKKKAP